MQTISDFLQSRGVRVLIVTFTPPGLVKAFLAERSLPFPIVSDPSKDAYRYFELGRTSLLGLFRPSVIARYVRYLWRGGRVRVPVDKDVMQLGGDFLFNAAGELAWSWKSENATDRPSPEDLKAAVDKLLS